MQAARTPDAAFRFRLIEKEQVTEQFNKAWGYPDGVSEQLAKALLPSLQLERARVLNSCVTNHEGNRSFTMPSACLYPDRTPDRDRVTSESGFC